MARSAPSILEQQVVLQKALLRLAEKLNINQKQLAQIIGLSEPSASRLYHGQKNLNPESKEGELALLLIRLYRSLDAILGGDEDNCRAWFHHYNTHLNGVPIELVTQVQGLMSVINYLDVMRGKL